MLRTHPAHRARTSAVTGRHKAGERVAIGAIQNLVSWPSPNYPVIDIIIFPDILDVCAVLSHDVLDALTSEGLEAVHSSRALPGAVEAGRDGKSCGNVARWTGEPGDRGGR